MPACHSRARASSAPRALAVDLGAALAELARLLVEAFLARDLCVDALLRAYSRTCWVISMLQNFGPHMEQKCATFAPSAGSVASWNLRAVSGSSARLNWSSQRNSKRAFESASSRRLRARVTLGQVGRVRGDLVGDHARAHVVAVGQAEVLLRRHVAEHRGADRADHRRADAPT